jgi:hypothetical protein
MTGLFHRLGARAVGQAPVLQPRRAGVFEPEGVGLGDVPAGVETMAVGDGRLDASLPAVLGLSVAETRRVAVDVAADVAPAAAQVPRAGSVLPGSADAPRVSPQLPDSVGSMDAPVADRPAAVPRAPPPPAVLVHAAAVYPARMVGAMRSAGDMAAPPAVTRGRGGALPPTAAHEPLPSVADRVSVSSRGSVSSTAPPVGMAIGQPGIRQAPPGAKAAGAAPAVEVTIGRVEIRFAAPAAPAPAASRQVGPPPLDVLLGRGGAR